MFITFSRIVDDLLVRLLDGYNRKQKTNILIRPNEKSFTITNDSTNKLLGAKTSYYYELSSEVFGTLPSGIV